MSVGLLTGLTDVINLVTGTAGPRPVTGDDLAPALADINAAFGVLSNALNHADKEANRAVAIAQSAATEVEAVGQDLNDTIGHTYRVVIPHSLSWLYGDVESHIVGPLKSRLVKVENSVKVLDVWRKGIDGWRTKTVDPTLRNWRGFDAWFKTWPTGVLNRWHVWFAHPEQFAAWAAPALITPLISYLSREGHDRDLDILSLLIVRAFQDQPMITFDTILEWLVTPA